VEFFRFGKFLRSATFKNLRDSLELFPVLSDFSWTRLGRNFVRSATSNGEIEVPGTKSYNAQTDDSLEQEWWFIDGENETVGRIAADIATVLMGKHKPTYTANEDTGDFVVLTNCEKLVQSGNKRDKRRYTWYTGYTGLKSETIGNRMQRKPEQVIRDAVRRMLPKNKIGRKMLSKFKIYAGTEHPHGAQSPKPFEQWRRSSTKNN